MYFVRIVYLIPQQLYSIENLRHVSGKQVISNLITQNGEAFIEATFDNTKFAV